MSDELDLEAAFKKWAEVQAELADIDGDIARAERLLNQLRTQRMNLVVKQTKPRETIGKIVFGGEAW